MISDLTSHKPQATYPATPDPNGVSVNGHFDGTTIVRVRTSDYEAAVAVANRRVGLMDGWMTGPDVELELFPPSESPERADPHHHV